MSTVLEAPARAVLPTPYVGQAVLWYPHADTNNEAVPGIVLAADGANAIVSVALFNKYSATLQNKTGVRHVADPFNKKNPDVPYTNGGWSEVDSGEPSVSEMMHGLAADVFRGMGELRDELVRLRDQINGIKGQLARGKNSNKASAEAGGE